ncbi:MAG: histidine phosphatase family protein [Wenzhouxiangellaceae bacterium]
MTDTAEMPDRARNVWLIRHAKAAEAEPGQKDIDRPLTRHGERQCKAMGEWLRRRLQGAGVVALVSPAERARHTAKLALGEWFDGTRNEEPRIWNASAQGLAELLAEHSGDLLVVGHNPGLEQLQAALSGQLMPLATGGVFEMEFGAQGRVRLAHRFQPETDSR